ncbi:MAG: riboflavin synthase [Pelagibacterales bacterium]|nr:riboflavin synthase [Pelagibacterales bacterium]
MFTGIITHIGKVESLSNNSSKDLLLKISTNKSKIKRTLEIGSSIACNGICLTLIKKEIKGTKVIFSFQASLETCKKTTLQNWILGQEINLEFALRVGDEFGGHIVSGHVDATGKIKSIKKVKDSYIFSFVTPKNLIKFICQKGSVAINGVSLTVNEVKNNEFKVNLIQHTVENTTFKNAKVGDLVNLEIDTIARYVLGAKK